MTTLIDWLELPDAPSGDRFIINVNDRELEMLKSLGEVEFIVKGGSKIKAVFESLNSEKSEDGVKRNLVWYKKI